MRLLSRAPRESGPVPPWPQHAEAIELLLIDDDEDEFELLKRSVRDIRGTRFNVDWVADYGTGMQRIILGGYDAYLVDYRLGSETGVELIKEARAAGCQEPMIMLTGEGSRAVDLEALEAGATDFLEKGNTPPLLLERTIRYAITNAATTSALRRQLQQVAGLEKFGRLLSQTGPTPDALDELMRLLSEDFGLHSAALYFIDQDILRLAAVSGYEDVVTTMDPRSGRLRHIIELGRAQEIPNVSVDPDSRGARDPMELCIPLFAEGRCLGILNVAWGEGVSRLDGRYDGLMVIADRLAVALALNRAIRGRSYVEPLAVGDETNPPNDMTGRV